MGLDIPSYPHTMGWVLALLALVLVASILRNIHDHEKDKARTRRRKTS